MLQHRVILSGLVGLTLSSVSSFADQATTSYAIHHQYQSARALGMGDAFVAVADDYSALFYNPAGLARREDGEINLSMEGGFSNSIMTFANDVQNASKTTGTDAQKQTAIINVLNNVYGSEYSFRTSLFNGIWVRPHWGIGVIPMDATARFTVHHFAGPGIDANFIGDTTVAYGYGKDIKGVDNGRLSVGGTLKFVNRLNVSKQILATDLAVNSNIVSSSDLLEGYTIDADLGMLWTPLIPGNGWWNVLKLAKPTFGAVVRNVGDYGFGQSLKLVNKNNTGAPESLHRVLDLGSKWEYPGLWIFGGRGTLDVRDIMNPNWNMRKGTHLGLEFDWRMTSWWKGQYRFGVNQGYFTAGLSALLTMFNLDLVTYGEDIGTYDSPQENRVYLVKMSINI